LIIHTSHVYQYRYVGISSVICSLLGNGVFGNYDRNVRKCDFVGCLQHRATTLQNREDEKMADGVS
jgi:hypothetical protein